MLVQLLDSRTVSDSHLDVMKQLENLTNLNVKDCPNVTEEGRVYSLISV